MNRLQRAAYEMGIEYRDQWLPPTKKEKAMSDNNEASEHTAAIKLKPKRPRRKAEYVLLMRHDSGPNEEGNTLLEMYSVELNKCASQTELIAAAKKAGLKGVYTIATLHRTIAITARQTERMVIEDVEDIPIVSS